MPTRRYSGLHRPYHAPGTISRWLSAQLVGRAALPLRLFALLAMVMLLHAPFAQAAEPDDRSEATAAVKSVQRQVGEDGRKTYFLMTPADPPKPPARGHGLLLILPGGDGSAEFRPFATNIYANAVPAGFLAAQLVAVKWTPDQKIVWPTAKNKVAGQKFTTEEFITAVVEDIRREHPLDPRRIFTLSWSSSGPAAYAASLTPKTPVTGSFVAMSVFNPQFLPPLVGGKGQAYYLYHSPEDAVCPVRMARQAKYQLSHRGAATLLTEYTGGHGWHGDVFADIRKGIEWLVEATDPAASPSSRPATRPAH